MIWNEASCTLSPSLPHYFLFDFFLLSYQEKVSKKRLEFCFRARERMHTESLLSTANHDARMDWSRWVNGGGEWDG